MKRIKYFLFMITIFLLNITLVSANSIYNIDIDVKLDENGTGHIREVWNMDVSSKTEVYKVLSNLGNSKITNFIASMDGTPYTYQNSWNVDGSLSEKAYKNGIYHENGDTELCWGMSNYGKHKYTITYDVSNMIYNVSDAQVLYWRFIDNNVMNPKVQQYSVKVTGPSTYADTLDVWGYGDEGGYAFVNDGYIYMSNADNQTLGSSDFVVLLTKFPLNTFNTTNSLSKYNTFDDFSSKAQEGSTPYTNDDETHSSVIENIIGIFTFLFNIGIFGLIGGLIYSSSKSNNYIKKEIDKKNLNNFRDIPCDKDIFKSYFISKVYDLLKTKEDLMGAVLLKWLLNKNVSIIKMEKKTLFSKKEVTAVKFESESGITNEDEKKLYDIMYEASKDGVLEQNELENWSRNHYSELFKWFDIVEISCRKQAISENHITVVESGNLFKIKNYQVDDKIYEEATKLAGLKKYLVEFSRIKEKEPIEVNLWEYYLIYAQIFGIAKEVAKQFKDLYPEIMEQAQVHGTYFDYADIMWIHSLSASSVSAASSARSAAQSYSSGGGGFSSGGGGGGSFGGGGGGCR